MTRTVIIGVGNEWRGDDGAGLAAVRRLAQARDWPAGVTLAESPCDPASLMDLWQDADVVILIDAVSTVPRGDPGRVHRFDIGTKMEVKVPFVYEPGHSTHGLGLPEAMALARALRRLPEAVVVYAIEGARFGHGKGLSAEVERGVREVAARIRLGVEAALKEGVD